jgi:hypothetical protein
LRGKKRWEKEEGRGLLVVAVWHRIRKELKGGKILAGDVSARN